jgi:Zn-dependent protease with chaperone function
VSTLKAFRYDGKSSQRREVLLHFEAPGRLRVEGEGVDQTHAVAQLQIPPPLGSIRRTISFPDGSMCEVEDGQAFDALLGAGRGRGFNTLLHRWENSLKRAVLALAVTVAAFWGIMTFGVPVLAKQAAFALPPSADARLGEDTLHMLDRFVFQPSQLPPARKAELAALFRRTVDGLPGGKGFRLELRAGGAIGANAFALPSGIVVMTDGMAQLAHNDEELVAVLAHEIGHIENRHTLRQVLQNSASALIVAAVGGDVFSSSSFAATFPTLLIQTKFSRDFEREADDYSVRYLEAHAIPTQRLADILTRLTEAHHAQADGVDYLSTHPATRERVEQILRAR